MWDLEDRSFMQVHRLIAESTDCSTLLEIVFQRGEIYIQFNV